MYCVLFVLKKNIGDELT